jgi:signal peptidase I
MKRGREAGSYRRAVVGVCAGAALAFAAVGGLFEVAQPSVVRGASMWPALADGERILVERVTGELGAFQRHDVVVLEPPGIRGERYVKRIVGLPGDVVVVGAGEIRVNGDSVASGIHTEPMSRRVVVPAGAYFVAGDNFDHSFDSRAFGCVSHERIIGRVVGK